MILHIQPLIARVHHVVCSVTFQVSNVDQLKIKECLKWEMWQQELYTFENISVVECSEDRWMIFYQSIMAGPKIEFSVELLQGSCLLLWLILKLSSPCHRCWLIHVCLCCLNDWAWWVWCVDQNGCHGLHSFGYFRCLLYNPGTLPCAMLPALSTPAISLWASGLVTSWVHVRSGFWGSMVSLLEAFSGGGAVGTLTMGRSLVY